VCSGHGHSFFNVGVVHSEEEDGERWRKEESG